MSSDDKIRITGKKASIRINPKIYPLEIVCSAAYSFVDRAYILLDGDPEKEITANLEFKDGTREPEKLVQEFLEELLNYLVYYSHRRENQEIRKILLERALLTAKEDENKTDKTGQKDIS